MDIGKNLTSLVVREFYENIYLLAYAINDVIVMLYFGCIFGKPFISLSVPTIKYEDNFNHSLHGGSEAYS